MPQFSARVRMSYGVIGRAASPTYTPPSPTKTRIGASITFGKLRALERPDFDDGITPPNAQQDDWTHANGALTLSSS